MKRVHRHIGVAGVGQAIGFYNVLCDAPRPVCC
jgi:hypothetical protein